MTVRGSLMSWISDFFFIAHNINRLDVLQNVGDFLQEIKNVMEIKECMANININLDRIHNETNKYKDIYQIYSKFWEEDAQ